MPGHVAELNSFTIKNSSNLSMTASLHPSRLCAYLSRLCAYSSRLCAYPSMLCVVPVSSLGAVHG